MDQFEVSFVFMVWQHFFMLSQIDIFTLQVTFIAVDVIVESDGSNASSCVDRSRQLYINDMAFYIQPIVSCRNIWRRKKIFDCIGVKMTNEYSLLKEHPFSDMFHL